MSSYTPTASFFHQHFRQIPQINSDYWAFSLGGMIEVPLILSYTDVLALSSIEVPCTLACIGNPPGGPHIGQAVWHGVYLQTLLDEVTLRPGARFAHILAADGYTTSITLEHLSAALLVYGMNGDVLSPEHGFPARLIIPGLYGYKMPKWVQRIELTDTAVPGFWERRGWSVSGEVQTTSAILAPRHLQPVSGLVTLSGVAFAGVRDIVSVEVSIDGAPWMPVPFTPGLRSSWSAWQIDWMPPAPGDYRISVRATDSSGFTQSDETPARAFPNGSSAIHAMTVRVVAEG